MYTYKEVFSTGCVCNTYFNACFMEKDMETVQYFCCKIIMCASKPEIPYNTVYTVNAQCSSLMQQMDDDIMHLSCGRPLLYTRQTPDVALKKERIPASPHSPAVAARATTVVVGREGGRGRDPPNQQPKVDQRQGQVHDGGPKEKRPLCNKKASSGSVATPIPSYKGGIASRSRPIA